MSFSDSANWTPAELIAQYVLELRGDNLFLPYQDYAVIDEWLSSSPGPDELLLVLSEVLPPHFEKLGKGKRSLSGLRGLVLNRIRGLYMRQTGGSNVRE